MAGLWYLRAPFGTNKPPAPVHPADCCTSGRPPPFILAQATQCLLITGAPAPANPYLSAHMQNTLGRQLNVRVSMNLGKCISANTITAHGHKVGSMLTQTRAYIQKQSCVSPWLVSARFLLWRPASSTECLRYFVLYALQLPPQQKWSITRQFLG